MTCPLGDVGDSGASGLRGPPGDMGLMGIHGPKGVPGRSIPGQYLVLSHPGHGNEEKRNKPSFMNRVM